MSQALATHFAQDALLPRAPGGMGRGAVLALLAHGALLFALTGTVQWRARPPEVFSAELWSAVPQAAAPAQAAPPAPAPPPEPAPTPAPLPKVEAPVKPVPPPPAATRDADIATEQARKLETQRKALEAEKAAAEKARIKAEADAVRKREEDKRKEDKLKDDKAKLERAKEEKVKRDEAERKAAAEAKAEDERLAKQREENLRRMMGQAGTGSTTTPGSGGTGRAAQSSAPSASYVGRLVALVRSNIVFTGQIEGNPSAEVAVRTDANGTILDPKLVKSSGNKDWDDAVLRAIVRTGALPRDSDGRVPSALTLVFRPNP